MAQMKVLGGIVATNILRKRQMEIEQAAIKRPVGRPAGTKTEKREGITYGRPTKASQLQREQNAEMMAIHDEVFA